MNFSKTMMTQDFSSRFTCLPTSYALVVAIHPLGGSRANRHHMPNPQSGAAQPTQDEDPQAFRDLPRGKLKNPSQSP